MNTIYDSANSLFRNEHFWKEYVKIRTLGYSSAEEYYKKTIEPQIYYRFNEGVKFREFEACIILKCWVANSCVKSYFMDNLYKTIIFFVDDFKKIYKYSWKFHIFFHPFLNLLFKLRQLIR